MRATPLFQREGAGAADAAAHARGNVIRVRARSRIEHVCAARTLHGPRVRPMGLLRATAKITLANLAYNSAGWSGSRDSRRP